MHECGGQDAPGVEPPTLRRRHAAAGNREDERGGRGSEQRVNKTRAEQRQRKTEEKKTRSESKEKEEKISFCHK